jgi:hypothetical protein
MQRQQNNKKGTIFYFCRKKEKREQLCLIPRQPTGALTYQCIFSATITQTIIVFDSHMYVQ